MEQSLARAAVDCRETDGGDVREETVVGNACGGKLGSCESKAESYTAGGAITIVSLFLHTSIGSSTIERQAHQRPDALNYRIGPTKGNKP